MLRSYAQGRWFTPADEGVPLSDAVTGEEITRISSSGVDMAAALDYGRRAGGPALRELTFHQRAALLKALASGLREHRDELYALSARTGATLGDSKFDVDGGIGVLFSYGSKGRRELPNDTVYVEGDVEPLGKGGTFVGQHICTPLRGVAVQINAFNFPVWGPLEKFAPAFLAGVPSLIKPASQTAYLTEKRPARSPDRPGPRRVHRLGVHSAAAAHAPDDRPAGGPVQRRGRLAELLDPRPGGRRGNPRVRPLCQATRHRDDGQSRAEVHRHPACAGAGIRTRRRGRRRVSPAGACRGRQPGQP
jgi:Aldehyde dehydrogenase family